MTLDQVMTDIRAFIKREFKIADNDPDFNDDTHIFDYGYVDSFGAVKIITFIQERFRVTISDTDLAVHPLNTVREIGTLVQSRVKAG